MKLLFLGSTVALLLHLLLAPFFLWYYLGAARQAMRMGHFEEAMSRVDQARLVKPQFYTGEVTTVCNEVMLAQARQRMDQFDFVGAAVFAQAVQTQCGSAAVSCFAESGGAHAFKFDDAGQTARADESRVAGFRRN